MSQARGRGSSEHTSRRSWQVNFQILSLSLYASCVSLNLPRVSEGAPALSLELARSPTSSTRSHSQILGWEFIDTCSLSGAGTCLTPKGDIGFHPGYLLLLEVFYPLIHINVPKYFANSQVQTKVKIIVFLRNGKCKPST